MTGKSLKPYNPPHRGEPGVKHLYIQTIGCQMNVYDSDCIRHILEPSGYAITSGTDDADLVILNTCAVREKAEQKAFSFLGRLADLKRRRPEVILGVGGCVAQQQGHAILGRMPYIDFVFGTRAIGRLPQILDRIIRTGARVVDVEMTAPGTPGEPSPPLAGSGNVSRFVTIMQGCDNYCSYCVVPYVRGREISRHPDRILDEIRWLVASGVREVTLLGQNVNSYGAKEGLCSFAQLLTRINDIDGLSRIRFTTSHPKDFSTDLMSAFGTLDKLCNHIHLPAQSGSNAVLKRMNRRYSREDYLDRIAHLRRIRPDIAITTDIIVGFPGETATDFEETLELIKSVEYDSLFAFMYSDRPCAPARRYPGKVPEAEKRDRLAQVLDLQKRVTIRHNHALVGSIQTVLAEGLSKRNGKSESFQWTGRTTTNKIVNFSCPKAGEDTPQPCIGKLVSIRIEKALSHSLMGRLIRSDPGQPV